jgi:hypothetical protein
MNTMKEDRYHPPQVWTQCPNPGIKLVTIRGTCCHNIPKIHQTRVNFTEHTRFIQMAVYKLGCPSRDRGRTCGPSLSLEQGIHFGNRTAPGRGGFLRTSVDKALFLRCYMGFGHTSHFFFLRLRTGPLSNGFLQQHAFLGISWIVPAYNAE